MPFAPGHEAPEASSSTAAEKNLSSLRARLRSEDIPPRPEQTGRNTDHEKNHVYAKLQAIFSRAPHGRADPKTSARAAHLAEIFALYGQQVYDVSLRAVQSAHEATSAKISAFHAQAAGTSAHARQLYNNISYPLSATLCQSQAFPSASLGRHLRTLDKKLSAAETELAGLNEEWKRCVGEEARILSEGIDAEGGGAAAEKMMGELVARIDDVVRRRAEEIDLLDEEYRHLVWAESNRMMQAMMAD